MTDKIIKKIESGLIDYINWIKKSYKHLKTKGLI